MGKPMRIRAKAEGGKTNVRVLMSHPMEGGQRKDGSGNLIPAHYISDVEAKHGGKTVMKASWGTAVSQNPYLAFTFNGGAAGEEVEVSWKDNQGDTRSDKVAIK